MDQLAVDGHHVPLVVSHNPRARRFIIRVDMSSGAIHVTTPNKRNVKGAIAFAHQNADWISDRLKEVPPPAPFHDGLELPLRGELHLLRQTASRSRTVRRIVTGPVGAGVPEIQVGGDPEFFARRVGDWLKKEARRDLNEAALRHAARLGVRPKCITVRDQSTRWGSCSSSRALSFSWRLILAPRPVLDYVAAHEVAHLVHMHHGPEFWDTVNALIPTYGDAVAWLEKEGPALHKYGVTQGAD